MITKLYKITDELCEESNLAGKEKLEADNQPSKELAAIGSSAGKEKLVGNILRCETTLQNGGAGLSCDDMLAEAGRIIRDGGLVAFPTETVYGLGGNALDETAAARIYAAKGRPSDNPLIAHIASMEELPRIVKYIPESAYKIAEKYWPGPITMIFEKSDIVPYGTTGGLDTVAVRMPSHPIAKALIKAAGVPVAAPSANVSGRPSPTKAAHVIEDLSGKIDAIIDGGQVDIGLESTIIDLTGEYPTILRPGYVSREMLEELVGRVDMDPALDGPPDNNIRPKAPGMMYRHYAPKGELTIVEGSNDNVVAYINGRLELLEDNEAETKVGIITTIENAPYFSKGKVVCVGTREDDDTVARQIYGALRQMDEYNVEVIYVESFREGPLGEAIMNRLNKAAGYRVVRV